MGIRAREYFNIGVDDIEVTSYAGHKPPVSCMNDGLQVSTGATLGHGLIRVAEELPVRPEARFSFKGKTIRLRLKPEYADRIRRDVQQMCIRDRLPARPVAGTCDLCTPPSARYKTPGRATTRRRKSSLRRRTPPCATAVAATVRSFRYGQMPPRAPVSYTHLGAWTPTSRPR